MKAGLFPHMCRPRYAYTWRHRCIGMFQPVEVSESPTILVFFFFFFLIEKSEPTPQAWLEQTRTQPHLGD